MRRLLLLLCLVLGACPRAPPAVPDGGARSPVEAGPAPDAGPWLDDPLDARRDAGLPPVARRERTTVTLHGEALVDDYAWVKAKGSPEVEALLAAENAHTDAWFAPFAALEQTIDAEFAARQLPVIDDAPTVRRRYEYWSRTDQSLEHDQVLRRARDGGREQLLLDLNTAVPDASYVDLLDLAVTDDERRFAWAVDTTGDRTFTLRVSEVGSRKPLPHVARHVTSFTWAADGKTLFFTTENAAKRPYKVWRWVPGRPPEAVWEEPDEHFEVGVDRSSSGRFVLIDTHSFTTSETLALDARRPRAAPRVLIPRRDGVRYAAEHHGDRWVVISDDQGPQGRLFTLPLDGGAAEPSLLVADAGTPLEGVEVFDAFYVVWERVEGLSRPRLFDWATHTPRAVDAGEGLISGGGLVDYEATRWRYTVESPVRPAAVHELDVATGATREVWRHRVQGFDPAQYEFKRLWATARDGARVPLSLARRRDTAPDAPLLLEGYAAYGDPLKLDFSPWAVSLLDRGVVLAWAHARGGGELGEAWHDAGRRQHKQNSFSDFITCAEHLIAEGHTSRQKLLITGMSAGGLLMGAVLNQRPDLFRGAVVQVPFVDVMNTMLDTSLPLTIGEFDEWGDPRQADAWKTMRAYSPYDNVAAQRYPPLLVRGAYHDTQVLFHEPTKWVQRLRATKTDGNRILLWMSMDPSGHGGHASRSGAAADELRRQVWMLAQWGLAQ